MIKGFIGNYRYLSNFWLCPIAMGDWVYPSTENAYQAAKYPKEQRSLFVNASPAKAKELGGEIELPKGWEAEKIHVMRKLLRQKFRPCTMTAILLAGTGEEEIIEGNTWGDIFWGVCDGTGENQLGKMLMEIRESLVNQA